MKLEMINLVTIFDKDGSTQYTVDKDGKYFHDGFYIGAITNNGPVTTFTNSEGDILYEQNISGGSIMDKYGHVMGTLKSYPNP